jgi:hypothetical protein
MSESVADDRPVQATCRKREGYIKWDDYFMAVAFLSAQRSKDPKCVQLWLDVLSCAPRSPSKQNPAVPKSVHAL